MGAPSPCAVNVFLDSDGPIADFDHDWRKSGLSVHEFKHRAGTYLWLPVTRGAASALSILQNLDNHNLIRVWIATKTPDFAPYAYTEKVLWYRQNFPWLENRVIVTHDKHLLGDKNDILMDDRPLKANVNLFRGTFFLFNVAEPEVSWLALTNEIENHIFKVNGLKLV